MFCDNCGAELREGSRFCDKCGAPAPSAPEPEAAVGEPPLVDGYAPADPGMTAVDPSGPRGGGGGRGKGPLIALIVVASLVLVAAVAALVWLFVLRPDGAAEPEGSSAQEEVADETGLEMSISQVDNAAYPTVSLYASFLDEDGNVIEGVDPSWVSVVELTADGTEYVGTVSEVAQLTAEDAMALNLVLDQSGSMGDDDKIENAQSAAHTFVEETANYAGTEVEITSFDDDVYNVQPFTTDQQLLSSAIDSVYPNGDTALYDALYWALQRTNLKTGSRVVIAFTDGIENDSSYTEDDVIELSRLTGIPVYIIGIGDDVEADDLRDLAEACNGAYYDADTADLAETLARIYEEIYASQRSMYRIVFDSTCSGGESEYRTIRISCEGGGYAGEAEAEYMPVDNVSSYDTLANPDTYVLPESDSRYYSADELQDLSLWELYLARNEIYARHGRGFVNRDLTDYFATRTWYQQLYTPEEFDAMASPLNDYERENALTLRSIEESRNSPYLSTGDH